MATSRDAALDHAWRYFELHANQRLTVFNFFTALASLDLAGLGATFLAGRNFAALGALLGLVLMLLSFVFWKLDQRAAFLIKHGEHALMRAEQAALDPAARVFSDEPALTAQQGPAGPIRGVWTFGRAFRLTFAAMAVIGLGGSTLSALRFSALVSLEPVVAINADSQTLPAPTKQAVSPSNR